MEVPVVRPGDGDRLHASSPGVDARILSRIRPAVPAPTRLGGNGRIGYLLPVATYRPEPTMRIAEPRPEDFSSPLLACMRAPRPRFLLAAVVPMLVGLGWVVHNGHELDLPAAIGTLLAGVLMNAAINLYNDYQDDLNGTDRRNEERVYPFTGGSRFIQNGILGRGQVLALAVTLFLTTIALGLWLSTYAGPGLIGLGLFGLLLGWGYSAPPLRFNSRGLGELAVFTGFGLLPSGAWLVQCGQWSKDLLLVSLPIGLLCALLLYVNQFPDRRADLGAGKLTLVARLGPTRARWGYPLLAGAALLLHLLLVASGRLPLPGLIALLPAPLFLYAARCLFRHADEPVKLTPALAMTIVAVLGYGLLLSIVLFSTAAHSTHPG
ncbi:MAG: 1,4-dihydroxy-2-naphthoate octaprenyltransferase [Gammaproteobacteria bacterium]|nr:MAG: 1,4-dihydroxy-2-naphthoate octaprenyltransferase [Gammaproteobacteria bacterium]